MKTSLNLVHVCVRPNARQTSPFIKLSALSVLAFALSLLPAAAKSIQVGNLPGPIAADPVRDFVYVGTNYFFPPTGSGTIVAIDTLTNTTSYTLSVGAVPLGVAVSPDGQFLYLSTSRDTLDVFSLDSRQFLYSYTTGSLPSIPGVSPDGSMVYVPNTLSGTVTAIESGVVSTIKTGGNPEQVAFTPDGKNAYVSTADSAVVINTATHAVTPISGLTEGGFGLAITPDGATVYVTSNTDQIVYAIATSNNSVTPIVIVARTMEVVNYPAVDVTGKFLYVPATPSQVFVIETKNNTVLGEPIAVGNGPTQVALKSPPGLVVPPEIGYCTNNGSTTVSVFKAK